ncbi:MAG: AAA family ATPase [Moorellaceae bacterium]
MLLIFGDKEFTGMFLNKGFPYPVVGVANDTMTATTMLQEANAREVVVGFPGQEGVEFAFHAAELYRNRRFYLALNNLKPTAALFAQAAAKGVRIIGYRSAAADMVRALGTAMPDVGSLTGREPAEAQVLQAASQEYLAAKTAALRPLKHQRVAVYSVKGGVGKTAIAANLAACAAAWVQGKGLKYRVVLVDGDIGGAKTAGDWLRVPENVTQNLLVWQSLQGLPGWDVVEKMLVKVPGKTDNLYFLPSPQQTGAESISGELMVRVLSILDQYFDLVVVDLSTRVEDDATLVTLQTATTILLVVTPEIGVIKRTESRFLRPAARLQINLASIQVVLNRTNAKVPFRPADIAAQFGGIPAFPEAIPEDDSVLACLNDPEAEGPVVLARPESAFAQKMLALTGAVLGLEMTNPAANRKNRLLAWLGRITPGRRAAR